MPEFSIDLGDAVKQWRDLDSFTQGYIEAAFFTDCEPGTTRETWDPETQSSLPGDVTFDDLAPETLARMVADCKSFATALDLATSQFEGSPNDWPDDEHAGRDFWYTRNGHGCGFWDGAWPEPYATELTDAERKFGTFDLYLGDDGKVYD